MKSPLALILFLGVALVSHKADPVIPTITFPDVQKAFSKHLKKKLGKAFAVPRSLNDKPPVVSH